MQSFYSHGKLLLTAEYFVLDGAKALAIPTTKGQKLTISSGKGKGLTWKSWDVEKHCWLEAHFELPSLHTTDNSSVARTLQDILIEAKKLNPKFLDSETSILAESFLEFPRNWGLGSSSTLINNIAQWASVDAFTLLRNSFGGSGYDIAVAKEEVPILYQIVNQKPEVTTLNLNWNFTDQLFFVHLNKKQDSKEGIARYKAKPKENTAITAVSTLTDLFLNCKTIETFERLIDDHEKLVSKTIGLPPIKETLFNDYSGSIKSLGAWGGDFVLATGVPANFQYFKDKGFHTIIPFSEMMP